MAIINDVGGGDTYLKMVTPHTRLDTTLKPVDGVPWTVFGFPGHAPS